MLSCFFLKICLMTITQHAHIYNFHSSNLCLKKYFFLNFYQCRPYFKRCHPCLRVRRVRRHRDHTLAAGPRSNPRSLPGRSLRPPHRLWPRRPPPPPPIIPPAASAPSPPATPPPAPPLSPCGARSDAAGQRRLDAVIESWPMTLVTHRPHQHFLPHDVLSAWLIVRRLCPPPRRLPLQPPPLRRCPPPPLPHQHQQNGATLAWESLL